MNKKTKFTFLLLCFVLININAQKHVFVKLALEGKKFDSLRIATKDTTNKLAIFHGKTIDHFNWTFDIPSDIWSRLDRIVLGKANERGKVRKYEYIRLLYQTSKNGKPILSYSIGDVPCFVPDWDNIEMKASYLNSDTVAVNEDNVELIYHNFTTIPIKFSGMEAWTMCTDFSLFTDSLRSNISNLYDSKLEEYRELVKEYPDSRLLLIKLHDNINKYHSVADAKSVFSFFSLTNQNSFIGKEITKKLAHDWTIFDNINLKNALNNKSETIIRDGSKFTLISFTASWCVYCKQEIPILKQIYTELANNPFEMVYIDLDDNSSIQSFLKQMIHDSIPWRVLIAYPLQNELLNRYAPNGIPANILIYPDRHVEYIDVRDKPSMNKLIEIVKNYK